MRRSPPLRVGADLVAASGYAARLPCSFSRQVCRRPWQVVRLVLISSAAFRVVCAPAVQLPPLRWRCSASRAAVLLFCLAARGCWRLPWVLVSSPAVLCCSAFCFYRALAWLLGRASGWLLGRYSNLWRVFRCLAFIAWRLCRRCFGCRCDDLRGGCCSCGGGSAGSRRRLRAAVLRLFQALCKLAVLNK